MNIGNLHADTQVSPFVVSGDMTRSVSPISQEQAARNELLSGLPSTKKDHTIVASSKGLLGAHKSTGVSSKLQNRNNKDAEKKMRRKKKWKKPKDKPNRPLSAYNLFFQAQRSKMLGDDAPSPEEEELKKRIHCKTHGKIGFAEMARSIGQMWKNLPAEQKRPFEEQAKELKSRYKIELDAWKEAQTKAKPVMATGSVSQGDLNLQSPRFGALQGSVMASGNDSSFMGNLSQAKAMHMGQLDNMVPRSAAFPMNEGVPGPQDQDTFFLHQQRRQWLMQQQQQHAQPFMSSIMGGDGGNFGPSNPSDMGAWNQQQMEAQQECFTAAEASANAILQSFQAGMPMTTERLTQLQRLQLQRHQQQQQQQEMMQRQLHRQLQQRILQNEYQLGMQ